MYGTQGDDDAEQIADDLRRRGATVVLLPGDLTDAAYPDRLVADAVAALGTLRGLVLSHANRATPRSSTPPSNRSTGT